jgi:mono/diheme cytochrome c family protein
MSNRLIPILAAAAVCIAVSGAEAADEPKSNAAAVEFFEKKVRPILVDQCQNCHGADRQKGGLRLDSRDAALTGGDSGAAIIAGNPEKSRLVKAVRYADTDLQMPPKENLTDEQVQVLTQWVKMGAPWPAAAAVRPATTSTFKITEEDREFWAFQPVVRPEIPGIRGQITNPIDAFVLAKLQEKGLKPAPVADKATLIRRAYFDLIGLPPTPQQVEAYVRDESPNAFAKVIDHLLASPHYGERWGRHWLDVARYGEDQAHTFQARAYPDGWRYRDWVVKAFNEDLP